MEAPREADIEQVKGKHPDRDLIHIEVDHDGENYHAIATIPTHAEWLKFQTEGMGGDMVVKAQAAERLVLAQVRWPSREEMTRLFERLPGLPPDFAGEITAHAGVSAKARSKKL